MIDFATQEQMRTIVNTVLTMPPQGKSLVLKGIDFEKGEARFKSDLGIVTINNYFKKAGALVRGIVTNMAQSEITVQFTPSLESTTVQE